jgi:hypothetical protein
MDRFERVTLCRFGFGFRFGFELLLQPEACEHVKRRALPRTFEHTQQLIVARASGLHRRHCDRLGASVPTDAAARLVLLEVDARCEPSPAMAGHSRVVGGYHC